jgi:glutamine synthetase
MTHFLKNTCQYNEVDMDNTKEGILSLTRDNDIKFIRLQFTDIFGRMKNIAITSDQLPEALNNKISFDGSSIEGFARIEESDMYLRPDLDTFAVLPWRPRTDGVARLICDVYDPDGNPYEGDPRYCLKRALQEAEDMGMSFTIGPECEFFIFHVDDAGRPTTITHDQSGYFDIGPMDLGGNIRREITLNLDSMGYTLERSHHESARGQHEVDFKYSDALDAADRIMTFKLAVKSVAALNGTCAVFLPKPLEGVAGSGMHTNMSLFKDGNNVFYDPTEKTRNGLSDTAYYFIGGIMKHINAITAVANPLVNSYKRLIPGYEAPVDVAWSYSNRSPLVRIPTARGSRTRIELRSPDMTCNPYLLFACCLNAGLDGVKNQISPPDPVRENLFKLTDEELIARHIARLPSNLHEAIEYLKQDKLIKNTLGEHIFRNYIREKEKEWRTYQTKLTNWEVDNYIWEY